MTSNTEISEFSSIPAYFRYNLLNNPVISIGILSTPPVLSVKCASVPLWIAPCPAQGLPLILHYWIRRVVQLAGVIQLKCISLSSPSLCLILLSGESSYAAHGAEDSH